MLSKLLVCAECMSPHLSMHVSKSDIAFTRKTGEAIFYSDLSIPQCSCVLSVAE